MDSDNYCVQQYTITLEINRQSFFLQILKPLVDGQQICMTLTMITKHKEATCCEVAVKLNEYLI